MKEIIQEHSEVCITSSYSLSPSSSLLHSLPPPPLSLIFFLLTLLLLLLLSSDWLQQSSCDPPPGELNSTLRRELKQFLGWVRKQASGCSSMSIKLYDQWRAWLQKTGRARSQVGEQDFSHPSYS